jgi:hypothetical protein
MNLISELRDVTPLRPEAYERARTVLRGAMAESGPEAAPMTELARGRNRRRGTLGTLGKIGIGAGIGAVAAGVAVVLAATSTAPPATRVGSASKPPGHSRLAVNTRLVSLATFIKATSGRLPGNASLVIQTQTVGGIPPETIYNLYTDSGAYYAQDNRRGLRAAIAHHENIADGQVARQMSAARYAATGNLAAARLRMAYAMNGNEWGLGLSPAAREKLWDKQMAEDAQIFKEKGFKPPLNPPTGKKLQEDVGNYIWNSCFDALTEGGGNPQIRAGVLRLLATIPEVTVANSTTGGQPTLTITAGSALFGAGSSPQVLTVNARTGVPIKSVWAAKGTQPSSVTTFRVSRVTLKDGKF